MQISTSQAEQEKPLLSDSARYNSHGKNSRRLRRTKTMPTTPSTPRSVILNDKAVLPFARKGAPILQKVILALAIYLGGGMSIFIYFDHELQGQKTKLVVDALYFCVVTMTGVGYGDVLPQGVATKLLSCAFVFIGMAIVGFLLSSAAEYLVDKQEKLLIKAIETRRKNPETEVIAKDKTKEIRVKILLLILIMVMVFATGVIVLHVVEKWSILNSFYGVCCTITTLGYGDVSFRTVGGRIFAVIWIPISTICLAQLFLRLAEIKTVRRQQALVNWVMTRRTTFTDLEAADMDSDGVVSLAEFVLYKLKEMGKIDGEDVERISKEFETLDVDESGTLTKSDLDASETVE